MFTFSDNKITAEANVRELNLKIADLNRRLNDVKPRFNRLEGLIQRVTQSGGSLDNPDMSLFTEDDLSFWLEANG